MTNKSIPFEDDENPPQFTPKRTLKITNERSSIKANASKPEDFRNKIAEILSKEDERNKLAFDLTQKYLAILKNKTLDEAKNIIIRDGEKSSIKDLIDFIRIVNSDENMEENIGTMSLLTTILHCMLLQRDRINELEYQFSKLNREVIILNAKINSQEEKK